MPDILTRIAAAIDAVNTAIGRAVAVCAIAMVLLQFAIVLLRYVFGIGHVALSEGVLWLNAALFLLGAGYALKEGAHVRVDIWYREAGPRAKAMVDLLGALLMLMPTVALVLWSGWGFVAQSWAVMEGSRETSGLPGVFVLKSLILAWAALLGLQGLALALRSLASLGGRP